MNKYISATLGKGTLVDLSGGFSPGPLLGLFIRETVHHGILTSVIITLKQLISFSILSGLVYPVGAMFLIQICYRKIFQQLVLFFLTIALMFVKDRFN